MTGFGTPSHGFKPSLDSPPNVHTQNMVPPSKSSPPRSKDPSTGHRHDYRQSKNQSVTSARLDPQQYPQERRSTRHQQSATPFPQHQIWSSPTTGDDMMDCSDTEPDIPADISPSVSPQRIEFYDKNEAFYGFTNFSPHPVSYHGKVYPTSEHLFQSLKFTHKPNLAEHIRLCDPRPSKAFSEARRFQAEVRPDWKEASLRAMDVALWHKFDQHLDLKALLLNTGSTKLVEKSDIDDFWGAGKDGKGRNELGKALERLRDQLNMKDQL